MYNLSMEATDELWDEVLTLIERVDRGWQLRLDIEKAHAQRLEAECDREYGRGHREGRSLGRQEGWDRREMQAEIEMIALKGELQRLKAQVEHEQETVQQLTQALQSRHKKGAVTLTH